MDAVKRDFLLDLKTIEFSPVKKQLLRGNGYLAFVNITRNLKGLFNTLEEEVGKSVDIEQLWVSYSQQMYRGLLMEKLDLAESEPILSKSYAQVLLISSNDVNMLDYAKHVVDRYLKYYRQIERLDPKPIFSKPQVNRKKSSKNKKSLTRKLFEALIRETINFLSLK